MEKVEQLKQNGILDSELNWLRSLLFASYDKSNDSKFRNYIEVQKDYIRDNPDKAADHTWKDLMSKASKKVDSLMLDSRREATSQVNDDPILAVKARLAGYQKTLQKV